MPKILWEAVEEGHVYDLHNVNEGVQQLTFIKKQHNEDTPEGTLELVHDGTINEVVLEVLIDRIEFLNTKVPDGRNESALQHLRAALSELEERTRERKDRGVEGTNKA